MATKSLTDNYLTVKEFHEKLTLNGVPWTQVWIRTQIGLGKIRSEKMFNARLVPREEATRIIKDFRAKKERTGR